MSHQLGRVVSAILHRYFGDIVQKVGDDLFTFGSKPIGMIVKTTSLTRQQVIESLRTLLKFDLATFEPSANEVIADYKLIPDNVLLIIRYPRYLLQIKSKYGSEAELLIEELLQQATCTATVLLFTIAMKYKDDKDKNITIVTLKDMFISLVTAGYIQQAPVAELKEGSEIPTLVPVATIVPDMLVSRNGTLALVQAMKTGSISEINDNIYWRVNYDRFHLDFRDEIMMKAITRRIDENAGELMRFLLENMYLTSPAWAPESSPLSVIDLRERCRGAASDRPLLHQFVDQYLKVLEENGGGFVRRVGDAGSGQYCVRTRHAARQLVLCALEHTVTERLGSKAARIFRLNAGSCCVYTHGSGQYCVRTRHAARQLVLCALEHTVTERLGSKAARIFRLVRSRKYIEEDDIQKNAMLVNKECKQLTYKLLEEHFISVQPMRKAASAGGLAKAIYLYHINLHDVAQAAQEMCYQSLHNVLRRHAHERSAHARLVDKQRRVRTIVHGMRLRGEPQQNIDDVEETLTPPELAVLQGVEKRLKQLSTAEMELDKNLFIFKWYFMFPETK